MAGMSFIPAFSFNRISNKYSYNQLEKNYEI